MKKFQEFINEQRAKRTLAQTPLFCENKVYIDKVGNSWLIESVEDDEIIATNQDTDETQTFNSTEFAQQVDDVATKDNEESTEKLSKLNQVQANLTKIGLEKIAQGQKICDNCDKDTVEFKQGQALQDQGHRLLKQAEEIKGLDNSDENLTLAQQIQQFQKAKEIIEQGQQIIEQGQIMLSDIDDISAEKISQQADIVKKAQDLIGEGCKNIVQGQKVQGKQALISQQEGNKQLEEEVKEQLDALKQQAQELQKQADKVIDEEQDKEVQQKALEISQAAQDLQKQADKLYQQDQAAQQLNQEDETDEEITQQQAIQDQLKQAQDEVVAAQIVQAQDQSEESKEIVQDLEELGDQIDQAQEIVDKNEDDASELVEEVVKKIDATIKKVLSQQTEKEENGQKVLTQSQAVQKIDNNIKVIQQCMEQVNNILKM